MMLIPIGRQDMVRLKESNCTKESMYESFRHYVESGNLDRLCATSQTLTRPLVLWQLSTLRL